MKIHLVAACGTAMGTLAGILKKLGHEVSGSDQNVYPPMSTELEKLGVELWNGYSADHLFHKPDLVVIGNAVRKDNVEARAAIDGGFKYLSFTDALAEYFLKGKDSIVVAGTHGKTTTTSLLSRAMMTAGADPSVFVGGIVQHLGGSFRIGNGKHVISEGDEYDTAFFDKTPKFWHYRVKHALITHVEYDHADIYPNIEAVEEAFAKFIELVPADGTITACASAPRLMKLLPRAKGAEVETYSVSKPADWTAVNIDRHADGARFSVQYKGKPHLEVELPLLGDHNIENALGVIAVASRLGMDRMKTAEGLAEFAGVKRRMEMRGEVRGVSVIDDFAHHPTAVNATIGAAQQRFPGKRILAVFEPRSQTSRRKIFQQDYENAFGKAQLVYIAQPFGTEGLRPDERFDSSELCDALTKKGVPAQTLPNVDAIVDAITRDAKPGDVVLVMSNGGFGGIHDKLLAALKV